MDVFGGEIRRRDLFPLLVLHLIEREPAYGNRLIEEIEEITDGRDLGQPQHDLSAAARTSRPGPDRGPLGAPGPAHPPLLLDHDGGPQGVPDAWSVELEPFLDSVIRSVTLIKREIYG